MDDLKSSLIEMYRTSLEACETRDECMLIRDDVQSLIVDLTRVAEDDCYDRANAIDSELAREGQHE